MLDAHNWLVYGIVGDLHLPYADATVPALLLEDARIAGREPAGQASLEVVERPVEVNVAAPAERPSHEQHLFGAHFQDGVRMRAHPGARRCHVAEERVQLRPVFAGRDRVHPDEHGIQGHEP